MFINDDNFSEVVDCVLYRYNYKDSLIWQHARSEGNFKKLSNTSILVSSIYLKEVMLKFFGNDIDKIQAMPNDILHKEATSVHFIWNMLNHIKSLRWVKMTINHNVAYNRVIQLDDMPTIKWGVKTLRGTLYTYKMFKPQQLQFVNQILRRSGVMKPNEHFTVIKMSQLVDKLEFFIENYNTSEVASVINPFVQELTPFEADNPEILLVTDGD